MSKDEEIIQSMIVGGLIGAALGALLTNKKNGDSIGAIAGAVLLATLTANENAKNANLPRLIEENDAIYEINSRGEKKLIKYLQKSGTIVPKRFTLK